MWWPPHSNFYILFEKIIRCVFYFFFFHSVFLLLLFPLFVQFLCYVFLCVSVGLMDGVHTENLLQHRATSMVNNQLAWIITEAIKTVTKETNKCVRVCIYISTGVEWGKRKKENRRWRRRRWYGQTVHRWPATMYHISPRQLCTTVTRTSAVWYIPDLTISWCAQVKRRASLIDDGRHRRWEWSSSPRIMTPLASVYLKKFFLVNSNMKIQPALLSLFACCCCMHHKR